MADIDWSAADMRDVFFDRVYELASEDERIVFLSADHGAFSLEKFEKDFPHRYINTTIAEQNTIGIAAGLALSGKIVYVYGIASFVSLRVLEQITIDLATMNLPVNIVSVGAGFTYSTDGPTHQGIQDLPAVMTVPNLSVFNSSDPFTTRAFAEIAVREPGTKYIRIEKGNLDPLLPERSHNYSEGVSCIRNGTDLIIVSSGAILHEAIAAAKLLEKETGLKIGVVDLYRPKPLPYESLINLLRIGDRIVTIEEGLLGGGIGQTIGAFLFENKIYRPFLKIGIDDRFCFESGDRDWMRSQYNLNANQIAKRVSKWLSNNE